MVAPGCRKRLPASASISAAAILSRVDLPEPLRPTSAILSPGSTERSAPAGSRGEPSVSGICCRARIGAAAMERGIDHAQPTRSTAQAEIGADAEASDESGAAAGKDDMPVDIGEQVTGPQMRVDTQRSRDIDDVERARL